MFRIRSLIILFMLLSINCDLLNAQRNHHITIGNSASAYFLSAKNNWDATYIGLMMLPEITGSRSFDNDEKRVFISARWTGLESLIAKKI